MDITQILTYEDIEKAYILSENHWSYEKISSHLRLPQGHVIRAVAYMQHRQCILCKKCNWRNGTESCVLPPYFCTHRIKTNVKSGKKEWMQWKRKAI